MSGTTSLEILRVWCCIPLPLGCARFPEFVQNFSERQILWSLCSIVFLAFTLKLSIQTSLSVAPELSISLSSHEKCQNFRKTSRPLRNPTKLVL